SRGAADLCQVCNSLVSGTEGAERTSGFRTIQIYPKDFPAVLQQVECGGKARLSCHPPNWGVLAVPEDKRGGNSCSTSEDREFIALLAGMAATWPRLLSAQPRLPRVGILWHAANEEEEAIYLGAVRRGLSDFGYVEGKNIILENRFPAEIPERFISLAADLA